MKRIYVLRHAKTELGDAHVQDHDRQLIERGRHDALNLGRFISTQSYPIDLIGCSDSKRTTQTYEVLCEGLRHTPEVHLDRSLYLAGCGDLIDYCQQLDDGVEHVMLIGHNPGLHHFCLTIAESGEAEAMAHAELKFPTCALAVIDCDCDKWEEIRPGIGYLRAYWDRHQVKAALAA